MALWIWKKLKPKLPLLTEEAEERFPKDVALPEKHVPYRLMMRAQEHHHQADERQPDAILVNPFDITQTARALDQALSMSGPERAERASPLRAAAGSLPPVQWFQAQLDALTSMS